MLQQRLSESFGACVQRRPWHGYLRTLLETFVADLSRRDRPIVVQRSGLERLFSVMCCATALVVV